MGDQVDFLPAVKHKKDDSITLGERSKTYPKYPKQQIFVTIFAICQRKRKE